MRKYRQYTDEDIINLSKEVFSLAALLNKLSLKPTGGNYVNMQRNLSRLKINTSHWTKQLWSKNKRLKDWSSYKNIKSIKKQLLNKIVQCQQCGIDTWQEQPIKLELHHVDGDRTNNKLDNLKLLCPNCHSQTDNFRKPKS